MVESIIQIQSSILLGKTDESFETEEWACHYKKKFMNDEPRPT